MTLSPERLDRFARHIVLPEVGGAGQAALAGAHIATVPYKVLLSMFRHPLTDAGIERFLADWKQANL